MFSNHNCSARIKEICLVFISMAAMAQVMYASLAWWSYTRTKDQEKLERLVGRLKLQGFLTKEDMDISQLASKADQKLFQAIRNNPHHVLYRLLPELKKTGYNTRARAHNFVLLPKDNSNFLPRMLYIDIVT